MRAVDWRKRFVLLLLLLGPSVSHGERHALLVGVGSYTYAPRPDMNLEGPPHDVAALKQVLVRHWGFGESNISTLIDGAATKARILGELRRLKRRSRSGDQIFFYYSGHGTSRLDPNAPLARATPYSSGALIPADFPFHGSTAEQLDKLILGRSDLRPLLTALDRSGRRIFVAFDSCYSGNAVRGLYGAKTGRGGLRSRYLNLPLRGAITRGYVDPHQACGTCRSRGSEPYPYDNLYYLAAASEGEPAKDIGVLDLDQFPTMDGKPHGTFTDALLRVLSGQIRVDSDRSGTIEYNEIKDGVRQILAVRGIPHTPRALPSPQEDDTGLGDASLFAMGTVPRTGNVPDDTKKLAIRLMGKNSTDWRRQLQRIKGLEWDGQLPELILKQEGQDVSFISGAGDLIVNLSSPAGVDIVQRVARRVWLKNLIEHDNGKAGFNLTLELRDGATGTNVIEGELLYFTVKSARRVHLLLLNVDGNGEITVLYPFERREMEPIPAGQAIAIPGERPADLIKVTGPWGTDQLILYGFEDRPQFLEQLLGRSNLSPDSWPVAQLESWLRDNENAYAKTTLRLISVSKQMVGTISAGIGHE